VTAPLAGQVALVTGAAQGIGRAVAIRCAQDGAAVWLADLPRQAKKLAEAADEVRAAGAAAGCIEADITVERDRALILDIMSRGPLAFPSVLVNNAGTQFFGSVGSTEPHDLEDLLAVHVVASFDLARLLARRWLESRTPAAIVNVASVAGHIHFAALSAYSTAKAAVRGMTGALAFELAPHRIRVNAVAPGHVDTEMSTVSGNPERLAERIASIPAARLGRPADVAALAAFLASDRASYITGQTVTIDGGLTLQ
jgi:NAD(P)-dependent dehydrogenase (short-subunit alcohol dehydrogenase family)